MTIIRLEHVQLAMPPGEEEKARAFFVGMLGFTEVPSLKPLQGAAVPGSKPGPFICISVWTLIFNRRAKPILLSSWTTSTGWRKS